MLAIKQNCWNFLHVLIGTFVVVSCIFLGTKYIFGYLWYSLPNSVFLFFAHLICWFLHDCRFVNFSLYFYLICFIHCIKFITYFHGHLLKYWFLLKLWILFVSLMLPWLISSCYIHLAVTSVRYKYKNRIQFDF